MTGAVRVADTRYFRLGMVLAAVILVADQATKLWLVNVLGLKLGQSVDILPVLSLTRVHNYGISLGMLQAGSEIARWGLVALTAGISIWLLRWLTRADRGYVALAVGLILGGAVGNIIDRVAYGYVVDFIHAHLSGWSFYVFNIADSAITIGVALLILNSLRRGQKPHNVEA